MHTVADTVARLEGGGEMDAEGMFEGFRFTRRR